MTRQHNSQNITIRCLTKPHYGLGHFRRCLTLAKDLKKKKYIIHFIIDPNVFVEKELISNKISFTNISNFKNNSFAKKEIMNIMKLKNSKILIIDLREFSENLLKSFQNESIKTILLDDAWTKTACADLIFNGTMVSKYHRYSTLKNKAKLFLGVKYFIIDSSFIKFQKKISQIKNKKKYSITISFGGTDPNNVTFKVLRSIISLPNISIKIIVGPYFKKLNLIQKFIKNYKHIRIIQSPQKIWKEFYSSDLVISSAGNTLFELATQNVPTLIVAADEHQIPYGKNISKAGFGLFMGLWKSLTPLKITKTLQSILLDTNQRKNISKNGKKLIDGKATSRIIFEIEYFLKKV